MDPKQTTPSPDDKAKPRKAPETAKDVAALFKGEKVLVLKAKKEGPADPVEIDLDASAILSFRVDADAGRVVVVTVDGRKLEAAI